MAAGSKKEIDRWSFAQSWRSCSYLKCLNTVLVTARTTERPHEVFCTASRKECTSGRLHVVTWRLNEVVVQVPEPMRLSSSAFEQRPSAIPSRMFFSCPKCEAAHTDMVRMRVIIVVAGLSYDR